MYERLTAAFWSQLGDGEPNADQPSPVEVETPTGVTSNRAAAGGFYSLAIGSDGTTYA